MGATTRSTPSPLSATAQPRRSLEALDDEKIDGNRFAHHLLETLDAKCQRTRSSSVPAGHSVNDAEHTVPPETSAIKAAA